MNRQRPLICKCLLMLLLLVSGAVAGHAARPRHAAHSSATHSQAKHSARATSRSSSHVRFTRARGKAGRSTNARGGRSHEVTERATPVQRMEPERATAIQRALIRDGYLSGEPSGNWDAASVDAMKKYQADNGWPTRNAPDSRALIKLGLGGSQPSVPTVPPASVPPAAPPQ